MNPPHLPSDGQQRDFLASRRPSQEHGNVVVWLVGLPFLALIAYFVIVGTWNELSALVSYGWAGVALLAAWLVGFPAYVYLAHKRGWI